MSSLFSLKAAKIWAEHIAQCLLRSASDPASGHPSSVSRSVDEAVNARAYELVIDRKPARRDLQCESDVAYCK
jgi:hypothetical protein